MSLGPETITVRPVTLLEAEALLDGRRAMDWHQEYPLTETLVGLRMLLAAHRAVGWTGQTVPTWWMHHIVAAGVVAGDIGFHGPPPADGPAVVELGYDVVPGMRRRGLATAACRQLLGLAWRDGAERVEAEVEADNPDRFASQRVLAAAGFVPEADGRWSAGRPVRIGP
jgi:RimJ/RimL family protein N-acetyltransferase